MQQDHGMEIDRFGGGVMSRHSPTKFTPVVHTSLVAFGDQGDQPKVIMDGNAPMFVAICVLTERSRTFRGG